MDQLWWQLPGPRAFVSRIVQDLRDGKNVIICMPEHAPKGLSKAVKLTLGDGNDRYWHRVHVEDDRLADPANLLLERFVREKKADAIWNAKTLSRNDSFLGRIIMLHVLSASAWPTWKEFLVEYEHACRSQSLLDRTLFFVLLVGKLALDPPKENVCLSHHYWRGMVDRLDMLLFTSTIFKKRRMPALQKEVATSVIAHIALWDPTLAQRLAHETIERILKPQPILEQIAKERNWETATAIEESWSRGISNRFNGQEKDHSAWLLCQGEDKEIERRIWRAQVGVMFPFVEEKRQEILTRLSAVLRVPFQTSFGHLITDRRELEIGHIASQIANNRAVRPEIRQLVYRLRDIRNSLAHLEPVPIEWLLNEELAGI